MTDEFWSCKKHNTAGNTDMGCYKCDPEYVETSIPEEKKKCEHNCFTCAHPNLPPGDYECPQGSVGICECCQPEHWPKKSTADKLAEARALLKNWKCLSGNFPMNQCPEWPEECSLWKKSPIKNCASEDQSNVEGEFYLSLLSAQDLVSRAEQKKVDAEIAEDAKLEGMEDPPFTQKYFNDDMQILIEKIFNS